MGAATGMANALFFVRRGAHEWVLRRPPPVVNAPGASDMVREWRVLGALEGTPVPHPQPLLLCEDVDVLGSPFLLMARVDGFTPVGILPSPFAGEAGAAGRRELSLAMVDAIAHLAQVDWRARRLVGFGKPDGFLDRQVPRWLAQLDRYRTREVPELEFVCTWLDGHRPTDRVSGIMHGDYSPFNVMIAPDRPGRVAAVVDWDTSTIGDPRLDIGHLLARWTEPGEEFVIGVDLEERGGLPSRAELASRYEASTGEPLDHLPYFQALSLFKLAIILEGTYARARGRRDRRPVAQHLHRGRAAPDPLRRRLRRAGHGPEARARSSSRRSISRRRPALRARLRSISSRQTSSPRMRRSRRFVPSSQRS